MTGPVRTAWFLLSRLALSVAAGVIVGLMLGSIWTGIALALGAALAWQLLNLYWLDAWLRNRNRGDPPDAPGLWGDVVSQVVQLHRRKRYHKERLLQVLRELRQSTAALPDGVIILNAQGEIVWFNPPAARLLGFKGRSDRGLRISNLVREPQFRGYLERGEFAEPLVVVRGAEMGASLSFQVVPYSGGQRLLLVRDVSRQVQLEAMRRDFVANASHELRSPLTVITGYLEMLLTDEALQEDLRTPLSEMQRQAQRMNGIVSDLLDLSRLDAQAEEAVSEEIDVSALCAILRRDVLARPQHPAVFVDIETKARLLGDEPGILSAFSNLVDNAVKYTPASGSIRLRWALRGDGAAEFRVTDTGTGIAPEHLPRLTERFYRVDAGRARGAGGSGLGLAIVKHVLLHHGATMDVQSTPGAGSTFSCLFPARRVRAAATSAITDPP
ncbi:MAG: phosphate regulon sensor histidine kinase PhoR [Steroidobacteraceae bacterium]